MVNGPMRRPSPLSPRVPVVVPGRVVHCADAIPWLAAQGVIRGASFLTSLPDVSELRRAVRRVARRLGSTGTVIWVNNTALDTDPRSR